MEHILKKFIFLKSLRKRVPKMSFSTEANIKTPFRWGGETKQKKYTKTNKMKIEQMEKENFVVFFFRCTFCGQCQVQTHRTHPL